jgi:acetoin utilization deacetylase AcuC-like enzyme
MVYVAFDPIYAHPLPEGHRFPMLKYELIPGQLLHEGSYESSDFFSPTPVDQAIVLRTHDPIYYQKLLNQTLSEREQRKIGFPQSPALTLRERIITQGTIQGCYYAQEYGVALNIAGGTHHAFFDRGEGFCLLNDFAVAANELLYQQKAARILIIDLDVHQGNGTAALFQHEPRVYTFSMHGAHNYPFHKELSDRDVPLLDGTNDATYLNLLRDHLTEILDQFRPDFACYLAGVDILETDKFGKLNVTLKGSEQRDRFVFESLKKRGIPCMVALGGGYSADVRIITEAHCQTFRLAKEVYS